MGANVAGRVQERHIPEDFDTSVSPPRVDNTMEVRPGAHFRVRGAGAEAGERRMDRGLWRTGRFQG